MNLFKKILSIISSFILVLSVGILIANNLVKSKLLEQEYVKAKMEESEFHEQISREIQSAFDKYSLQSGLPEHILKDLFTDAMIKRDVESILSCFYNGTPISLSDKTVRETLDERINEYINSTNMLLTTEGKANIENFKNIIVEEYKRNINVSSSGYAKLHEIVAKFKSISDEVGLLPWMLIFVFGVLIIWLNSNNLLRAMNYISTSILSLGMLLKIGVTAIVWKVDLDNLILITISITNFVMNIVKEVLYELSDIGMFCMFCGIVGVIASEALKGNIEEQVEVKEKEVKPHRRKLKK